MMTKEVRIIILSAIITALGFGAGFVVVQAESTDEINVINQQIDAKRSSIDQINRQIEGYKDKIAQKQAEQASLRGEVALLDNRMAKTKLEIAQTGEEVDLVNAEIRVIEAEIRVFEQQLARQQEMIANVLREIQVVDNDLPLQTLFGNDSLAALFDELEQLETVSNDLKKAADAAEVAQSRLALKRDNQQIKREQLLALEESLEGEVSLLEQEESAKIILISYTQQSEAEFQRLLTSLREEQSFINQQILLLQTDIENKLKANDQGGDSSVLSWPIDPTVRGISSYFHDATYPFRHLFEHSGLDLPGPTGLAVTSAAPGYVAWTRQGRLYGNYVMVIHTDGVATLYAHLSSISVSPDQFVGRGESLGTVGSTGFSTGPHLHFEVRKNGLPTNPLNYLMSY
jgi:murein DD-endopeptidase MepM/ murein hydrolase activator NlpD